MKLWSAGGRCPMEGCNFAFGVESEVEAELDIVGAAVMSTHSDLAHEGIPVTIGSFEIMPKSAALEDARSEDKVEDEGRPRLIN